MSTELVVDSTRESQVRARAKRIGILLRKDRARQYSLDRQGGYMLVDADRNCIVAGEHFDLDLDDVEAYLTE